MLFSRRIARRKSAKLRRASSGACAVRTNLPSRIVHQLGFDRQYKWSPYVFMLTTLWCGPGEVDACGDSSGACVAAYSSAELGHSAA